MREDTHAQHGACPFRQPRFARILQTVKLLHLMDEVYPQRVMVETHKGSLGDLQCEKFPTPPSLSCWKTNFKIKVCFGSDHPKEAMPWIQEIELANSIEHMKTSQSITGRVCP